MAIAIKIPDVGTTVDEVTIVKWRKKKGEFVKRGEIIVEIETDKAVVEIESIAEGKILEILYKEGEIVKQGSVIAYVGDENEKVEEPYSKIPTSLKNLAERFGVDISKIKSSRADGMITRQDILNAARKKEDLTQNIVKEEKHEIPFHQKTIIKKVVKSHLEIPPVHFVSEINMDRIIGLREKIFKENKTKIFYDAFFVFSCARCIKKVPAMSSFISGEKIEKRKEISIAIAIAQDDKLFTPVIRSADTKTLIEINTSIENMIEKIKQSTISADEMENACFLISNLGMYPVEQFIPIIYPGHSGALGIGKIAKKFVIEDDIFVVRNMCKVILSCDHRLINGSVAGLFLRELKEFLENGISGEVA